MFICVIMCYHMLHAFFHMFVCQCHKRWLLMMMMMMRQLLLYSPMQRSSNRDLRWPEQRGCDLKNTQKWQQSSPGKQTGKWVTKSLRSSISSRIETLQYAKQAWRWQWNARREPKHIMLVENSKRLHGEAGCSNGGSTCPGMNLHQLGRRRNSTGCIGESLCCYQQLLWPHCLALSLCAFVNSCCCPEMPKKHR